MEKLKLRWGIQSNMQFAIIFIVFAINGSLSAKISGVLMKFLNLGHHNLPWFLYYPIFIILVLPLYPFMLIVVGYLFGQHQFFFPFAKKLLKGIGLGFVFGSKN